MPSFGTRETTPTRTSPPPVSRPDGAADGRQDDVAAPGPRHDVPETRSIRMSPPEVSTVAEPVDGRRPGRRPPASAPSGRPSTGPSWMSPPYVFRSAPFPAEAMWISPECVRIFTRPLTWPT